MTVAAIVLAAGAGTRFRDVRHKLSVELPETGDRRAETVVERSLAAAVEACIGPVVVVTGSLDANDLGLDRRDVTVVHNSEWHHGQATSVRAGLDAAARLDAAVAVVGLGDQPGIPAQAWRDVAGAAVAGAAIAVAVYDGRRRNPVAIRRDLWSDVPSVGDEGARSLMRLRPELVREVPCSGSPDDIDTVEDLERWQNN